MSIPTNRDEAVAILRAMMTGAQKARSISLESFDEMTPEISERILIEASPWLFGPKSILPLLIHAVQQAEAGEPIQGAVLMNLAIVATRLEPSIAICAINAHGDILPQPDEILALAGRAW